MPVDGKKMIFDKIQVAENCFGDLCTELSSFAKKKARYIVFALFLSEFRWLSLFNYSFP